MPLVPEDRVVAGAAVDGGHDERRRAVSGGGERVVPTVGGDVQVSTVPMSMLNGAGVIRSKRTRVPLASSVNCSAPFPPLTLGRVGAGAAFVEVGVVARVPDHPVVSRLAEHLVVRVTAGEPVVARAADQDVGAALAEQHVVARLTDEHVGRAAAVRMSLPAPPTRTAAGRRRFVSLRVSVSLPAPPTTIIDLVLATVGVVPVTAYGAAVHQDPAGRVRGSERWCRRWRRRRR